MIEICKILSACLCVRIVIFDSVISYTYTVSMLFLRIALTCNTCVAPHRSKPPFPYSVEVEVFCLLGRFPIPLKSQILCELRTVWC